MSEALENLTHYLMAWNEMNVDRVRSHLEKSCAEDVLFVDPAHTTTNIDELEKMIVDARRERPTASYHRISGVDAHNQRHRLLWEVRLDGEKLIEGMDVTTVDDANKIIRIDGFFGPFPPMEP